MLLIFIFALPPPIRLQLQLQPQLQPQPQPQAANSTTRFKAEAKEGTNKELVLHQTTKLNQQNQRWKLTVLAENQQK